MNPNDERKNNENSRSVSLTPEVSRCSALFSFSRHQLTLGPHAMSRRADSRAEVLRSISRQSFFKHPSQPMDPNRKTLKGLQPSAANKNVGKVSQENEKLHKDIEAKDEQICQLKTENGELQELAQHVQYMADMIERLTGKGPENLEELREIALDLDEKSETDANEEEGETSLEEEEEEEDDEESLVEEAESCSEAEESLE
ncbi:hypothetical protein NHX12_024085 [Muraenolepis orangiensis]|uniref:Geminin n=1 Tax=Muraenolepis orangiensis TaxID=630683 RepID=A0A9Q0IT99_9TELE|nr:hypothetical protein NHX12_024085 [Muraenolepis orangiensis]